MKRTLLQLRRQAIGASVFPPTTLPRAIQRLGFVQADPVRSPARAQDLILRHRVKGYRNGDLERLYPTLDLEEDVLYAYGFVPRTTWRLLHPRPAGPLTSLEETVLELVAAHRHIHPRQLEAYLGAHRELNPWGGYSKATTQTLQALHYRGLLRVAGRDKGIRLYQVSTEAVEPAHPPERLRRLTLLIASILGPLPEPSLRATLRHLAHSAPGLEGRSRIVDELKASGDLAAAVVDEISYVWPVLQSIRGAPEDVVRFLAPFDPLVWDRRRFEHFWGWPYRFEAYTPPAKRKLGYYALPMLWRDDVIGWVNVSNLRRQIQVEPGFCRTKPTSPEFQRQFEAEVERFRIFLSGESD